MGTPTNAPRRGGSITLPEGATDEDIDAALRGTPPDETQPPPAPAPAQE